MTLENKVVVVTGGSSGLGKATALRLALGKAKVVIAARNPGPLEETAAHLADLTGVRPLAIPCDISSESEVDRLADIVGGIHSRVDVLVNNAGVGVYLPSERLSNPEMRRQFEVNFFGAYYCTKALLPLLKRSEAGYILNVGSIFALTAYAENSVYAATKYALRGFTLGLRQEMAAYGIEVGLFLPGPMATNFQKSRNEDALRAPKFLIMEAETAAGKIEGMIRRRRKEVAAPCWMPALLQIKNSVGNRTRRRAAA
jgi:short-subunit dehydrogenase